MSTPQSANSEPTVPPPTVSGFHTPIWNFPMKWPLKLEISVIPVNEGLVNVKEEQELLDAICEALNAYVQKIIDAAPPVWNSEPKPEQKRELKELIESLLPKGRYIVVTDARITTREIGVKAGVTKK